LNTLPKHHPIIPAPGTLASGGPSGTTRGRPFLNLERLQAMFGHFQVVQCSLIAILMNHPILSNPLSKHLEHNYFLSHVGLLARMNLIPSTEARSRYQSIPSLLLELP
jgi:hypothetical protein